MKKTKVLVTGGTGFAGSHLLEALTAYDVAGKYELHATRFGSNPREELKLENVTFHSIDLTNQQAVFELFKELQPDQVYHLASFAAVGKSFETAPNLLSNNINLQLHVLEAVRQFCPEARILSIGSAEEYGLITNATNENIKIDEHFPLNPINPYAVSKVTQELLAQAYFLSYKLNIVKARPFNHIGERQAPDFVVPAFVSQIVKIERGEQDKLMVGNLEAVRDFTDVKDMVKGYILLMEKGQVGEVYNLGSGQGWKIADILDTLVQLAKVKVTVEQDPSRLRPSDIPYFVANNHKITTLGWKSEIAITQTLERILNEWRKKL